MSTEPGAGQTARANDRSFLVLLTLIPANLLVIVALFALAKKGSRDLSWEDFFEIPEYFSILCYMFFILSYSIYLGTYYKYIWHPYYSLYERGRNDLPRFIFYASFIVVFSIVAMLVSTFFWPLYVIVIFSYLFLIKWTTQRLFREAVDDYLNQTHVTADVKYLIDSGEARRKPPLG